MKNKKIYFLIIVLVLALAAFSSTTYSRYVLTRNFDANITSAPFYFEVTPQSSNVVFPRTTNKSDFDEIITTQTTLNLNIKNNDGQNYNNYDTTYTITIVDSPKFTFAQGSSVTKTLSGGQLLNATESLDLKIADLNNPSNKLKIEVTSTAPYKKTYTLEFNVIQEGAIQTIEDLVDLSLAMRNLSSKYTRSEVYNERFKLTRDLDFEDPNSYENAYRTDYNDVNTDSVVKSNLMAELTQEPGFLPIGSDTQPFQGAFNGGNHTLSNLLIHKSLQTNIGFFGYTINATIKDFIIDKGEVVNNNQTAGMLIGKAEGGLISNIEVKGTVVESKDIDHRNEDTYTGGLIGFIEKNGEIINCINRATVTTTFNGDTTNYSGPAGGIAAWVAHTNITNCKNYGTISGQSYVGGIAGFFGMQNTGGSDGAGTLSGCQNLGIVQTNASSSSTGGKQIGGIAGYNKKGATITNNKNGIQGGYENGVLINVEIHGYNYVGGIVGYNYGTLTNNTNYVASSKITGNSSVGTIYGYNNGTQSGNSG